MTTVTVQEIERDPVGWFRRVEAGESLLALRDSVAVAEIKPVAGPLLSPRPFGLCAGEFLMPDDFDDPLPETVLREFECR